MKNYQVYAGIDVSKATLDITLVNNQSKMIDYNKIKNNKQAIDTWVESLRKQGYCLEEIIVCFENTGVYSMLLNTELTDKNIDFTEVPALEIQRSKGIRRGKSDKNDSKDIALYCLRNKDKIELSKAPTVQIMELKLLFAEREKILQALKAFTMTKENEGFVPESSFEQVKNINNSIINDLKKNLKKIKQRVSQIIHQNETLLRQKELLKSVPGIGEIMAIYLLITTKGFTAFKKWRKFACYSGIAPFEHSSGTSVRGRNRVNHFADKKSKAILHMCAMTAIRHDNQIKAYYNRKKEEGKHSMLVINNVKNKIISRAFAVINRGTPFTDTYQFAS